MVVGAERREGATSMLPTPSLSHLSKADLERLYDPAEDTFILLDALEQDGEELKAAHPRLCVEIGSGSGCVSAFAAALLGPACCYLTTDLSAFASSCTLRTGVANSCRLEPHTTDLLSGLADRLKGQVDLLVFNPPYVETGDDEAEESQKDGEISRAWAGGKGGMAITSRLLELLPELLSEGGSFYLVCVPENKPDQIIADLQAKGMEGSVGLKRRAGREILSVLRFRKLPLAAAVAGAA